MFSPKAAFEPLKGQVFESRLLALKAMKEIRQKHAGEVAPNMGPAEMLGLALRRGWVKKVGQRFVFEAEFKQPIRYQSTPPSKPNLFHRLWHEAD